jgi:hypothetical protein
MNILTMFRKQMTTAEIVEQIHHEFNTEGERLLEMAKEILSFEHNDDKAKRLRSLGFGAVKEVEKADKILKQKRNANAIAAQVQYFLQHYPQNRFINEDGVKRICEKYGLLCADVSKYIGTVPDDKLMEIENFKLRQEDVVYKKIYFSGISTIETIISKKEYDDFYGGYGPNGYQSNSHNIMNYSREDTSSKLLICAPVKDFKLDAYENVDGYKIKREIPDPVVLKPVTGGYLIVAAWGPEASDEEVIAPGRN